MIEFLNSLPSWANTILVSAPTTVMGFLLGMRKARAEATSKELTNVDQAIKIWRQTSEALQVRIAELERKITSLEQHIDKLTAENRILSNKLKQYNAR